MYFSEREQGFPTPNVEEIGAAFWGAFVAIINSRMHDGAFAEAFPFNCPDKPLPIQSDNDSLGLAVKGAHPEIPWPLEPGNVPDTLAVLDLVEFFFRIVSVATDRVFHDWWGGHYDILRFNKWGGQRQYREAVDELFRRNRHPYELLENGEVRRIFSGPIQRILDIGPFQTGDTELDRLLTQARDRFYNPDSAARRESLERLWDAWQRVKTLEDPETKQGVRKLLESAESQAPFRDLLDEEGKRLTEIGNDFMIRHTETTKVPITDLDQVDYLFHRLYALLWFLLKRTNRIT
jgi:hypothetical protein